jgi:hypothetical protein
MTVWAILAAAWAGGCKQDGGTPPPAPPAPGPTPAQPTAAADWTVMVFLNGDNNLEPDSLNDFREMAKVGSTDKVNVVLQYDRHGQFAVTAPNWSQTLRFRVKKDMQPLAANALEDLGEANMGSAAVLRDFVTWAKGKYPARRYALVLWDHGQGFRVARPTRPATVPSTAPAADGAAPLDAAAPTTGPASGRRPFLVQSSRSHRSISTDDTNGHDKLYNAEITEALSGMGLDLIGFDACLMSMVETAYAVRGVADVMVGSEELEPGAGWQYDDWLGPLTANPAMTPEELGHLLVESYKRTYTRPGRTLPDTTLSAVRVGQGRADALAGAVSEFADVLVRELPSQGQNIRQAREDCRVYAPDPFGDGQDYFYHVDFGRFCDRVAARCNQPDLQSRARAARAALDAITINNYAGAERQGDFGSHGLAIYFPATGTQYRNDVVAENGYEPSNTHFPVAFVRDHRWASFLHQYFEIAP